MSKTIFWDMDGTLGFFEHIAFKKLSHMYVSAPFGPKEGIEELLQQLQSEGFEQYVTTSAIRDYATRALRINDMKKYFKNIFSREDICGRFGAGPKNYSIPLKAIGIDVNEAKSDVLIVGNSMHDVPYNMDSIVSIIDHDQWMRTSELTRKMIYMLIDNGEGNFNNGFQKLYADAEKIDNYAAHLSKIGRIMIDADTELHLKFMQDRDNYSNAPVFHVYRADKYYNENTKERLKSL